MRKEGIKESVYDFVKRMLTISVIFAVAIGAVTVLVIYRILSNPAAAVVIGILVGAAVFMTAFRTFLNFPSAKGRSSSKKIERDILFAARDLIIALRSGMPLFNAITSVSSGYGEASKEFLKVVERVQLGTPLEDAIDLVVSESKSKSFRKIMLQASVSIKVGADVTEALQSVIDQLAQERVIELRRYGQRLNAIAMFYMLFGIILPSMGIAVLTILTTFIPIFTVNSTLLEAVVVGIVFLQVVFLQLIRGSRPVFSM
jgi:flagellar protein FlaJ